MIDKVKLKRIDYLHDKSAKGVKSHYVVTVTVESGSVIGKVIYKLCSLLLDVKDITVSGVLKKDDNAKPLIDHMTNNIAGLYLIDQHLPEDYSELVYLHEGGDSTIFNFSDGRFYSFMF